MKYIKEYSYWDDWDDEENWGMGEHDERGERWLVPLHQPEFYICLRKLGMSDEKFEVWKNLYNNANSRK